MTDPDIATEPAEIPAPGAKLRGTLFLPPKPAAAVMVNGATGVPAGFYAPFARWLAGTGYAVLIWDYRDFGASGRPGAARRSAATMTDWAIADPVAVRAWMAARLPGLPLWVVGHSLGGMALPFQPRADSLARIVAVAAGPVHLRDHPWRFRPQAAALWYLAGPLALAALGYLPGRRLGLGSDLPAGVFRQWRRWCTTRASLAGDPDLPGLAQPGPRCPATLIALADDAMMPPAAVRRLADWLPEARVEHRLLDPADFGLGRVGHIAAFAPRNRALWPALLT